MKGLLIKDLKLFKTQGSFLMVILGICIVFIMKGEEKISMVVTYASAMLSLLVINTVGYDEHDNGMSYLFTFPISRRKYVLEKYVLGILASAVVLAIGCAVILLMDTAGVLPAEAVQSGLGAGDVFGVSEREQMWFEIVFSSLLVSVLILSVALPVQLKFGSEKSRIVMFGAIACVVLAATTIKPVLDSFGIDFSGAWNWLKQMDMVQTGIGLSVLMLVLFGVSYWISLAVLKRKQF